jgi:hypothetical protein
LEEYGWCLRRKDTKTFLLKLKDGYAELDEELGDSPSKSEQNSHASPAKSFQSESVDGDGDGDRDGDGAAPPGGGGGPTSNHGVDLEAEHWYELRDDDGELYYFNSESGASQWEPPRWFSETDPETGIVYYVDTSTGEPQWHKPDDFVPVIREEVYSTPQADYIKSMLSPKRSRYGRDAFSTAELNL